jgi:hypothetical protein
LGNDDRETIGVIVDEALSWLVQDLSWLVQDLDLMVTIRPAWHSAFGVLRRLPCGMRDRCVALGAAAKRPRQLVLRELDDQIQETFARDVAAAFAEQRSKHAPAFVGVLEESARERQGLPGVSRNGSTVLLQQLPQLVQAAQEQLLLVGKVSTRRSEAPTPDARRPFMGIDRREPSSAQAR